MTDIQGMPGTKGSLLLRIIQFVFAGIALCVMATTRDFPMDVSSFRFLMVSVIIQCLWSLCMAGMDIFAMLVRRRLMNFSILTLFAVGDGATSSILFAASSGCAGVMFLIQHELETCWAALHVWKTIVVNTPKTLNKRNNASFDEYFDLLLLTDVIV
ncbi:CASP-like protein 5A1 [Impatiens glandulifera]|uniref:CASP-like protein 5A1 n=1 Tax=Impatiens glandulifera TaxID=253017 RepID=UPI001FB05A8D|nr:CASP-like protein 5A1 [Impatiens glandulifera]